MSKLTVSIIDDGAGIHAIAIRETKSGRYCESTFSMSYNDEKDHIGAQLKQEVNSIFGESVFESDEEILEFGPEDEQEETSKISPEQLITWLESLDAKKIRVVLTLGPSQVVYYRLKDQDYSPGKTPDLERRIAYKLYEKSGRHPDRESYTYRVNPDGSVFVGLVDFTLPVLNMLEEVQAHFGRKLKIDYVISQVELLLSQLEKQNVKDTTLIHLHPGSGNLIVLNDGLPATPISFELSEEDPGAKARLLVQRLLLEIDKGSIDSLYTVHISAQPEEIRRIREELKNHIPGLEVYGITCEYEKEEQDVQAISLAYAGLESTNDPQTASFLPERIREAQQMFKLRWHGIILLLILAATPWAMYQLYEAQSERYTSIEQEYNALTGQINELAPIASQVETMEQELAVAESQVSMIREDARYATKWTQLLTQLEQEMNGIGNSWLTGYRADGDHLHIEGFTIYRDQVAEVADIYPDSRILRVSQGEMRGMTVYAFRIRVSNIRQNIEEPEEMIQQQFAERSTS